MPTFKVAAAQVTSVGGDIERNLSVHAHAVNVAAAHGVSLLVFPELSSTGYEPAFAEEWAVTPSDQRLRPLEALAQRHGMTIVLGAPLLQAQGKPALGAIAIADNGSIIAYHKMHLGGEEPEFFEAGDEPQLLAVQERKVGLAICADSKVQRHREHYAKAHAEIYTASMFLTAEWYETDIPAMAECARHDGMLTVIANHAGSVGTYKSVGRSAIWTAGDNVLVQAAGTEEVLLMASEGELGWAAEAVPL